MWGDPDSSEKSPVKAGRKKHTRSKKIYEQMVYAQPGLCTGKWDAQTPLGFSGTNKSPNLDQMTRP